MRGFNRLCGAGLRYDEKEISEQDYYALKSGTKKLSDFFDISEICGYGVYGATLCHNEGRYYISYEIGTSCD